MRLLFVLLLTGTASHRSWPLQCLRLQSKFSRVSFSLTRSTHSFDRGIRTTTRRQRWWRLSLWRSGTASSPIASRFNGCHPCLKLKLRIFWPRKKWFIIRMQSCHLSVRKMGFRHRPLTLFIRYFIGLIGRTRSPSTRINFLVTRIYKG